MAGSMADQLLKMGLVSDKQAKKVAHGKRTGNKQKGKRGVAAERRGREDKANAKREAGRAEDKARGQAAQSSADAKAEKHQVAQIVESGRPRGRTGGPKRFYYEARDGRVPYVEVNEDTQGKLEQGQLAVAESSNRQVTLINAEAAKRVADMDGEWLRVWNG